MSKDALLSKHPCQFSFSRLSRWFVFATLAASLPLLTVPRAGAQDSQDSPPPQQQQSQGDDQQAPTQDRRKVISRDDIPQNKQAPQDSQDQDQNAPRHRPPMSHRRQVQEQRTVGDVPANLTVPAGKVNFVRLNELLSSDHNHAGDTFTATLDQPIVVNGWVVARRGQTIVGTVTAAQKAGRVKGVSQLGLAVTDVTVVDGQQIPVTSELWTGSAGTSHGADAAAIVGTTGFGAAIGAAAAGGTGAAIGAGAGAVASVAAVLLTRGKPTVLGPETRLSFRLKSDLTVSTENSKQAFQPAGSDDYNTSASVRRRGYPGGPYPAAYPPPYYASCGPYWGCGYPYYGYPYYYGPSIGFYYGGYWGGHYGHGFGHGGFHH